jgi:hypothetical protein
MKEYTAHNGKTRLKPSLDELMECEQDGLGFCIGCGETHAAEPDAARYVCDCCGDRTVYGASELVLYGLFHN